MKLLLITPGRTRAAHFREAIGHYTDSIATMADLEYLELKDQASDPKRETEQVIHALTRKGLLNASAVRIILLEVQGKALDSPGLARRIVQWQDAGIRTLVFVIGGAYGLDTEIRRQFPQPFSLSLSAMTFPHELARVILLEQVYRALHIQAGSKYHHE